MGEHTPGPCEVHEPFRGKVSGPSIWAGGMLLGQVAGLAGFDYANARLWAAAPAMLAELRRLEWSDTTSFPGDPSPCCPSCYRGRDKGHAPDCTLAAAIRMAEES
jgi:hypothetical protein